MVRGSAYGGRPSPDDLLAISRNEVPGKSVEVVTGINNDIGLTFEDLWGPGGVQVLPTGAETLEILSGSENDSSSGSGVATVLVRGLDADYVEQSEIVPMNGTTPVVLSLTYLRTRVIVGLTNGTGGGARNVGAITLRVSGGGATRQLIEIGDGNSFSSHYTVPAGMTAQALSLVPFIPKNGDITMRTVIQGPEDNAAEIVGGSIHMYQNSEVIPVRAPFLLPEKTDLKFQILSGNTGATTTVFEEFLLTDH